MRYQKKDLIDFVDKGWLNKPIEFSFLGIVELIDAIQDFAVDEYGLSEEEVFGIKLNE